MTTLRGEGVAIAGGVHARWLFHGTDATTLELIVNNPTRGFTPHARKINASGKDDKLTLWGEGVYFARDAQYPNDFSFAKMAAVGTKNVLLCLVVTGNSVLGGADQQLHLKSRDGFVRYDSMVDDLSTPEIFVVAEGGQASPAYVIQYHV
jgi:hypothetical protein